MKRVVDEYTITSVVYPNDFEAVSEDIPCLGGIYEGKGTIIYRCKGHPDWSVFILEAEWVDDKLHGPFSIHHDGRVLVSGKYQNDVIQFKGRPCSGIRITDEGMFPIPIETRIDSSYYTSLLRLNKQENPAKVVDDASISRNDATSPYESPSLNTPTPTLPLDDVDYYEDDVIVAAASSKTPESDSSLEKRLKDMVKSMLFSNRNRTLVTHYTIDNSHSSFWFLTSNDGNKPFFLSVRVTGGMPNGNTFIYQRNPLRFLGPMIMSQGVCQQFIPPRSAGNSLEGVVDLSENGDRWEGEVRNMKPNGKGQYFNDNNLLVYEGSVVGGRANGLGTSFYDNGVREYYGMWSQGRKHGWGTEYDRKGEKTREGVWVGDEWAAMKENPLSYGGMIIVDDYNLLVNVMFVSASYQSLRELEVSNFPVLQALFIDGKYFGNTNLILTNLPSLRKLVVSDEFGSRQFSYYYNCLLVSLCPLLSEVWLNVDMRTGVIFKEKSKSKPSGKYDPVDKRKFEKRFVLEELKKVMGWKQTEAPYLDFTEPQKGMKVYIHVDRTSVWMTNNDYEERWCDWFSSL